MSGAQTNGGGPVAPVAGLLGRLAGGDWQTELDAALAAVGIALRVDRCYVFQNLRGPDGRLWMDLRGEWDAPDIRPLFADPKNHLHPYFPDFQRWIDVMSDAREINGPVREFEDAARRALEAEGTVVTWQVPVLVGGEWWGSWASISAPSGRSSDPTATWSVPSPRRCRLRRPGSARTRMRGCVRTSIAR